MTTRKILHAADIHLDSPLRKLDTYENAPADQIREASRQALVNMTDLAIAESVDLVVIAGDLYDGDWPDQNTGHFFVHQASRLVREGIRVAVIRGNHDAANKMTNSLPLPKNPDGSTILLDEKKVDCRRFEDIGVAVHGRSYAKRAETGDMVGQYPDPLPGLFNLGLLHTGLSGLAGHDPYAPCTSSQLADKEYDYWALGHIHLRGEHQIDGAAPVVFSGNVQGRHIHEAGPKGCVLLDVDSRNRTTRHFHPLDVVRWESCRIDATSLHHVDELCDEFEQWLSQTVSLIDDRLLVVRVRVEGVSPIHQQLVRSQGRLEEDLRAIAINHGAIQHGASQVWLERLKIRTHAGTRDLSSEADTDQVGAMEGPLASIEQIMQELISGAPEETQAWVSGEVGAMLKKLPKELSGDDDVISLQDTDELHRAIEDAAAELMQRLQGTDGHAEVDNAGAV